MLNLQNRTLAIMDNLPFLRSLDNECIDLIAIDPPFAANETFTGRPRPPITDAELQEEITLAEKHGVKHDEGRGTTVRDIWTWDENVHPGWLSMIEDDYPPVFAVIKAVEVCASENEAAYIAFMAVRLIECRRVLKSTGSIYVHCDSHANSYLRMLLDAIFGVENFIDEIVWNYGTPSGGRAAGRKPVKTHETLLAYAANYGKHTYNKLFTPYSDKYVSDWFRHTDESGRKYQTRSRKGKVIRQYLDESPGVPLSNTWTDIKQLYGSSGWFPGNRKEITGYATQKPLALYERIIAASSNPGDTVLDIFAGCATTAVAAERLGRQWIACDIAYRSWTMLKRRFALKGYALSDMTRATTDALDGEQPELTQATSFTIGPNNLPVRSDEDPAPFHNLQNGRRVRRGQPRSARSASWSGRIPKEEAKELLVEQFGAYCWGCGWEAPRFPNGEYDLGLLEVDHIRARRPGDGESGGSDELYNLALLHATCNRAKGNRMTLEELRRHNADAQRIYGHLVPLHEAIAFAAERIVSYAHPEGSMG